MRCPNCHKRIKSEFCPYCGTKNPDQGLGKRLTSDSGALFDVLRSHKLAWLIVGLLAAVTLLCGVGIGSKLGKASLAPILEENSLTEASLNDQIAALKEDKSRLADQLKQAQQAQQESEADLHLYTTTENTEDGEPADQALHEIMAEQEEAQAASSSIANLTLIPAYIGEASVEINDNTPFFTDDELSAGEGMILSDLDELGRAGSCMALVTPETLPGADSREALTVIKPSGWTITRYDTIEGRYLYERCRLIGYGLAASDADPANLMTGTRYLAAQGMEPYENQVADYINTSGGSVLYRATPVFRGDNLVADGVLLEACSVEDQGESLHFNVFCYNIQPGVLIDYATGDSSQINEPETVVDPT